MKPLRARFNLTTFTVLFFTLLTIFVLINASDLFSVSVTASVSRDEVRATSPTGATLPLDQASEARLSTAYGKLPMSFEANRGQTDAQVKFLTRGDGYSLFLTSSEAVLSLSKPVTGTKATPSPAAKGKGGELQRRRARPDIVRMRLVGANPSSNIYGVEELPGRSNYFIGNDASQWHTDIAHYARIKYEAVYRGVDVIYYGNQRQLEYDFIVAPGANPSAIKLAFEGTRSVEIDADGELVLKTRSGELRQRKPFIYQEVSGERREVTGGYVKHGQGQVGFKVGLYDPNRPLVIDPVLVYSTYLGGSGNDLIYGVAADGAGNPYVAGYTASPNFPTTASAFQSSYDSGEVAFVTKLDATGLALVYSTFLGGSGSVDQAYGIAVDSAGHAYVVGTTNSQNFPTTAGAFDTSADVTFDAFVTKLNPSGSSLIYSTCLGGSSEDRAHAVAIDGMGHAFVSGYTRSANFAITPGAFDPSYNGGRDIFVTKLNVAGSALAYSTYIGGNGTDQGNDIVLDESGNAYVTGETSSPSFPTTIGAFDTSLSGGSGNSDAFVTKLNAAGSTLSYSTILGGSWVEVGNGVAVDSAGYAYVTGYTTSQDFPVASGAFDPFPGGSFDIFVTKVGLTGSTLIYSTYLGSVGVDIGYGIAVDELGHAYVTGSTDSPDFPTTIDALDTTYAGGTDTFVTALAPTGAALTYSSFLGGSNHETGHRIVVDATGNVYVAGLTKSTDFPTTPGTFDNSYNGGFFESFITKLSGLAPTPTPTPAACPNVGIEPQAVPAGTVGVPHSLTFVAMDGIAPYSFAASGNLPPGLNLSSSGQLTGTPTNIGTFNFTLTAIDANNCAGQRSYQLVIGCPVITLSPESLSVGTMNAVYEQLVTPAGGTAPYTFMLSGNLPPSLNLDTAGRLSGTPSALGSFTFTVTATDALGCDGNATYTVTINPAPTPTPVPTPTPSPILGNGKIAFETNRDGNYEIYIMSPDGSNQMRLTNNTADDKRPAFSPDGTKIVFVSDRNGNYEIYVMNVDGTNQTRLTTTPQNELWPSFSPDGSKIAYNRGTGNASEIFVMNADGTSSIQITSNSFADDEPRWSPNGTRIVFHSTRHNPNYEIYVMNADGTSVDRLTNNNVVDAVGSFSLDGTKILFSSNRSGNYELMVMNIDGSNPINLSRSTTTSDVSCRWSADGTKIIFVAARDGNAEIYSMNADGTGQTRLTVHTAVDEYPAWQPVWQ